MSVKTNLTVTAEALSPEVHNPHNHDDYDNADAEKMNEEDDDGDDDDTNGCGDDGGNKQEDGDDDYGDGVITHTLHTLCPHKMIHRIVLNS